MSRGRLALPAPPGPPPPTASAAATDGPWYRAHHPDFGAWFFASATADGAGGGRFDLPDPHGTCYMAADVAAAIREHLGHIAAGRPLTAAAEAATHVTTMVLTAGQRHRVVDTLDPAAAEVITREIATTTRYRLTRRWARHWHETGHSGIRYQPRYTTGPAPALAVFGPAGPADGNATAGPPIPAASLLDAPPVGRLAHGRARIDDD